MLKFIDSYRFMQDSLANLVNNLSGTDTKDPENKFIDNMSLRQIYYHSLSIKYQRLIEKYHEALKKNKKISL